MAADSYTDVVKLVADFERAVVEGTHEQATPANHFHIEAMRQRLLRAYGPNGEVFAWTKKGHDDRDLTISVTEQIGRAHV